jgi:hypothetical protein
MMTNKIILLFLLHNIFLFVGYKEYNQKCLRVNKMNLLVKGHPITIKRNLNWTIK